MEQFLAYLATTIFFQYLTFYLKVTSEVIKIGIEKKEEFVFVAVVNFLMAAAVCFLVTSWLRYPI